MTNGVDPHKHNTQEYGEEYPGCPNVRVQTVAEIRSEHRCYDHSLQPL